MIFEKNHKIIYFIQNGIIKTVYMGEIDKKNDFHIDNARIRVVNLYQVRKFSKIFETDRQRLG